MPLRMPASSSTPGLAGAASTSEGPPIRRRRAAARRLVLLGLTLGSRACGRDTFVYGALAEPLQHQPVQS